MTNTFLIQDQQPNFQPPRREKRVPFSLETLKKKVLKESAKGMLLFILSKCVCCHPFHVLLGSVISLIAKYGLGVLCRIGKNHVFFFFLVLLPLQTNSHLVSNIKVLELKLIQMTTRQQKKNFKERSSLCSCFLFHQF